MTFGDYASRLGVMALLVMPVGSAAFSVINWLDTAPSYPFGQMLLNDLFVTYLFGLIPMAGMSIVHTALVARLSRRVPAAPLASSTGLGVVLGAGAGGLVTVVATLGVPVVSWQALLWTSAVGLVYGLLVGRRGRARPPNPWVPTSAG